MKSSSSLKVVWGISVGSMHWAAYGRRPNSTAPILRDSSKTSCPPSVLLGREESQSLRLDCWFPSNPIGTGNHWPPEATVTRELGSGRYPVAAAWFGRLNDEKWRWRVDGNERTLGALEAISFTVSQLALINARQHPCVIVIPNDFQQREQQRLLDDCNALGLSASLLWLPIAASLAWVEENLHSLPDPNQTEISELPIAVVHCDWGLIRISKLKLVINSQNGVNRWVPARSRPIKSDESITGFGWHDLSACSSANVQDVWNRLFITRSFGEASSTRGSSVLQEIQNWSITRLSNEDLSITQGDSKSHDASHGLSVCSKHDSIQQLRQELSSLAPSSILLFVGDFADSVTSAVEISSLLQKYKYCVADGIAGEQLLAKGASIFARNQVDGRLSYLDTLPNLELFVDRGSQYEWISLLGEADKFVAGGKEWQLQEPIRGLSIRQGASSIKLAVSHEDEFVRELRVPFDRPIEVGVAAPLYVSATPAQGNAKLRFETDDTAFRSRMVIHADWKRMNAVIGKDGRQVDKVAYASSQPRSFPNVKPRPADKQRWEDFERQAKLFLANPRASQPSLFVPSTLKKLLESAKFANGCSALSSNGKPPYEIQQQLVDQLAKYLFSQLEASDSPFQHQKDDVLRVLAYMSANGDGIEALIRQQLISSPNVKELNCLLAGNCIRTPELASTFIVRLLEYIPKRVQQRLLSFQMQAIARLISQREDALSLLSEDHAYQLLTECLKVFKHELESSNLHWLFEHSGLVVVYTLRYRTVNTNFLSPETELALKAKQLFGLAIEKLTERLPQRRQLTMLGSNLSPTRIERLVGAIQQLIDYIDKKGEGPPGFRIGD
jgi:hypothetical protein